MPLLSVEKWLKLKWIRTFYHSGFQNIMSVSFVSSLSCSFLSLHTCLTVTMVQALFQTQQKKYQKKNSQNLALMELRYMSSGGKNYRVKCNRVRRVATNSEEG